MRTSCLYTESFDYRLCVKLGGLLFERIYNRCDVQNLAVFKTDLAKPTLAVLLLCESVLYRELRSPRDTSPSKDDVRKTDME